VVQELDVNEIISEMNQLLEVSMNKSVVLRYALADDLPAIEADPTQIRQVVMNLVINAGEAVGDTSGCVTVATGVLSCSREYLDTTFLGAEDLPEGVYAYLEVSDTGHGIAKDTLRRVFDPFFTTKFTGRGLGLAAVLGVARGHGGTVKVYTEEGRGTTFKVLFPTADGPARPLSKPGQASSRWRGAGTVLLVDDDATVRRVGRMILEGAGFDTKLASDGEEAIAIYSEMGTEIVAVLLDLTMPKMAGEEAFTELRKLNPEIRVVLTSGYNEQDATNRFTGKGLAGFLKKPYEATELITAIRKAIERD